MSDRKLSSPQTLSAPFSPSQDLYKLVADEFGVSRMNVKHLCMELMYSHQVLTSGKSLVDLMRSQVETALRLGLIEKVK